MTDPEPYIHRRAALSTLDDRPRPPPSLFVGSGRGVTVTVLTIVAVLLVARVAVTWWLIEDAWTWLHAPLFHGDQLQPAVVPPPDLRLAGRAASGDPAAAFGADAYPPEAIRAGQQGRTVALLRLDASGTPVRCSIQTSSGAASLDRATCRIAVTRLRMVPARDGAGRAIASDYRLPVRWVLPRD